MIVFSAFMQSGYRGTRHPLCHIINLLLTKLVRSRWLGIGLVLFLRFMDLDFVSVHKNAKRELGRYPAILTSRLVNNIYVLHSDRIHGLRASSVVETRRKNGSLSRKQVERKSGESNYKKKIRKTF